jgi:hypothetical protein
VDPLAVEHLLIAIGLGDILAGTPRFGVGVQEEAAKMPARVRADLLSFLNGGEGETSDVEFDWKDALDQLTNEDTAQRNLEALYAKLPPEVADEINAAATPVVMALQGLLPRRVSRSTVKLSIEEPAPEALFRFKRQWTGAVDPRSILRDPMSADPTTVAAVAQFYPDFYQSILTAIDEAIATMRTRRGEAWDLDHARDRALRVLLGAPAVNLELASDFASVQVQQQAPQPRKATAAAARQEKQTTEAEQLPSQR